MDESLYCLACRLSTSRRAEGKRVASEWHFFKGAACGVSAFESGAPVFLDPEALSECDEEHSEDEDQWITLGLDRTGSLLVVCHTYREETNASARIRLISVRKATKNEARQYRRK